MTSSFILPGAILLILLLGGWFRWQLGNKTTREWYIIGVSLVVISGLGVLYAYRYRRSFSASGLHPSDVPRYAQGQLVSDRFELDGVRIEVDHRSITPSTETIQKLLDDPSFYTQNLALYEGLYRPFLEPLNQKVWDRSLDAVIERRKQNRDRLRVAMIQRRQPQKIPFLTHCVWISNSTDPYSIPTEKIQRFFTQINAFPQGFTHYIWFFNLEANKKNVQQFLVGNTQNRTLKFLDLTKESAIQYGKDLFDVFYSQKRYTQCSDIVRFNLVYLFGGIYFDLGMIFSFDVESLLWLDYFGYQEGFVISTTFIAAKPRSFVYYAFLNLVDNLYRFRDPQLRLLDVPPNVSWSALGGWTFSMDNFLPHNEVFLPIEKHSGLVQINHSASWVHGALGQPSSLKQPIRPENYMFTRQESFLPKFYSDMRYGGFGQTYTEYFARFDKIPMSTIRQNRRKLEQTFDFLLVNDRFSRDVTMDPKIPRVLHKIWLTRDRELSPDQCQTTLETYHLLRRSYFKWRFIFWVNHTSDIPQTFAFIRESCPDMEIRVIDPERDLPLARFVYEAFLDEGRFANACDILRLNILLNHGGLYLDVGVRLLYDVTALMHPFENVLIFHSDVLDTGVVAAAPGDPLWESWLSFLEKREYKKYDRSLFRTPKEQMPLTGCYRTMHLLDSKFSDRKVLFLQDGFYVQLNRLGSWYASLEKSTVDLWKL